MEQDNFREGKDSKAYLVQKLIKAKFIVKSSSTFGEYLLFLTRPFRKLQSKE